MSRESLQRGAKILLGQVAEQIGERVTSLIGTTVGFAEKESGPMTPEDLSGKVRKRSAVLLLESASGEGRVLVVFRVADAILFAATLLMMPPNQISEMARAGEMDKDMADAFSEVSNIVYGAIGDLTMAKSPEHGKLRSEGIQLVDPSNVSDLRSLWPVNPAVGAEVAIDFPGFQPGTVFIVCDSALLSRVLGIPVTSPAAEASEKADGAARRLVLLFGKDDSLSGGIRKLLEGKGFEMRAETDPGKAVDVILRGPMIVIAEFTEPADPAVARVCEAAVEKGRAIPVVGISHSPTRETILSARKAGVRAFLVHPISAELFQSKMDMLLAACAKA